MVNRQLLELVLLLMAIVADLFKGAALKYAYYAKKRPVTHCLMLGLFFSILIFLLGAVLHTEDLRYSYPIPAMFVGMLFFALSSQYKHRHIPE